MFDKFDRRDGKEDFKESFNVRWRVEEGLSHRTWWLGLRVLCDLELRLGLNSVAVIYIVV